MQTADAAAPHPPLLILSHEKLMYLHVCSGSEISVLELLVLLLIGLLGFWKDAELSSPIALRYKGHFASEHELIDDTGLSSTPSIRTSLIDTLATAATVAIKLAVLFLNDNEGEGTSKMIWRLAGSVGDISAGTGKGG